MVKKCLVFLAITIAANAAYGPLVCFWDEPDNFLAPAEVGPALVALCAAFRDPGQLIVTSHNPEAIRQFSNENTMVFYRRSHLEPANVRSVADFRARGELTGSLIDAVLRGDLPE